MTTIATRQVELSELTRKEVLARWKVPIAFAVFLVISIVLYIVLDRSGVSTFQLSEPGDVFALPTIPFPVRPTGIVVTIVLAAITLYSGVLTRQSKRIPIWLIILFAFLFMVAFLAWGSAGNTLPFTSLLIGTVSLSVPLIFGALGGVIGERGGVVNIAIEGQLLAGAFVAALVASATGHPVVGLIAAMVAGMLVAFVLAAFSITYFVDQIIVGVVLNVLVLGLTNFLYSQLMVQHPELNAGLRFSPIAIPGLSEIPIIGPILFRQSIIVYLMYIAVAAVYFGLFHTRWGLRLRSVGEHPKAADTVGIDVRAIRFWSVALGGAIVGLGGAFFTLGSVGGFTEDMTGGQGYIALAAVIFGRWDPIKATLAALLFGFATNLQNILGIIGSPVPSEFMLMLPYVVTIIAVAGLVGRSRPPAADGQPYIK